MSDGYGFESCQIGQHPLFYTTNDQLEVQLLVKLLQNEARGSLKIACLSNITRPNCALDRRTILCLYVTGFHRQVFEHVKFLSERSKEMKEQKKNKGSVLVAESAYNAQNAQFGLVMKFVYR